MKSVPKRTDRKAHLFHLKGGKCLSPSCPLPNNGEGLDPCCFDFHHRDPSQKEFSLNNSYSHLWGKSY